MHIVSFPWCDASREKAFWKSTNILSYLPLQRGEGGQSFAAGMVVFCSLCTAQAAEVSLLTRVAEAHVCSGELGCLSQCESGSLGSAKTVNLGCCVCVGVKQSFVLPRGGVGSRGSVSHPSCDLEQP